MLEFSDRTVSVVFSDGTYGLYELVVGADDTQSQVGPGSIGSLQPCLAQVSIPAFLQGESFVDSQDPRPSGWRQTVLRVESKYL